MLSDFITGKYTTASRSWESLTGTTKVLGHEPVHWRFLDSNDNSQDLYPQVQHIPDAGIRLFSPQQYFVAYQGGSLFLDKHGCNLTLPNGNSFGIPYNRRNNLPMLSPLSSASSVSGCTKSLFSFQDLSSSALTLSLTDETNQNITSPQKELLVWHWRLGHLGFGWIQYLMSPRSFRYPTGEITSANPVIITKHSTTRKCCHPKCAGCTMGKGQQRNSRTSASRLSDHVLSRDILKPGELIFVDQFESSIKGRLSSTKGKES